MQDLKPQRKISVKQLKNIIIIASAVVLIVLAIVLVSSAYSSRVHFADKDLKEIYGASTLTGDRYPLGVESQEDVKNELRSLKKVGKTEPGSYLTYFAVEFSDYTYMIKYASENSVVVIKSEDRGNGSVSYGPAYEYETKGSLPDLCKTLEVERGLGYVYE